MIACAPPTATHPLSLHDALPISIGFHATSVALHAVVVALLFALLRRACADARARSGGRAHSREEDRKSTRLNSSHSQISYAVCCLKKKRERREGGPRRGRRRRPC